MPVRFENFEYSFFRKGKPVFAPSERGRRIGSDIKKKIEHVVEFPSFYYHLRRGGHVAALHEHRSNVFFARLDVERFFYSIGRNRVERILKEIGIERPSHYARWSTVKNPFGNPSYAVPYGFVQSPIIATLVLDRSPLGSLLRSLDQSISVSVYVDDISLSSSDPTVLLAAVQRVREAFAASGFSANESKTQGPARRIEVFNCDLSHGATTVTLARISDFEATAHNEARWEAFQQYRAKVESGNL